MTCSPKLTPELIEQFVLAAHGNLVRVQDLHSQQPDLLNAKWEKFDAYLTVQS